MRKLKTRILVGGAVAVFAGATAFAVTSTADAGTTAATAAFTTTTTTTTKTSTTLSITARKATIAAGRRDVISGKLTEDGGAPVGRRVVELYRYDAKQKKWVLARIKLTHKAGGARFIVRPLVTAEYELVYHGNDKLAASRSAPVTVTVTK
jgi:hypothetical protein